MNIEKIKLESFIILIGEIKMLEKLEFYFGTWKNLSKVNVISIPNGFALERVLQTIPVLNDVKVHRDFENGLDSFEILEKVIDVFNDNSKTQHFIVTHNYFAIRKCFNLAQQRHCSVKFMHLHDGDWRFDDLLDDMVDCDIVDLSIGLYEEEVNIALVD